MNDEELSPFMDLGGLLRQINAKPASALSSVAAASIVFPMAASLPSIAHPGLELGPSSKYASGSGTHIQDGKIYASIPGAPALDKRTKPPTVSIPRLLPSTKSSRVPSINVTNKNTLPKVGSIILGKVTRCMIKQVNVAILVVDDQVCADEWSGLVRREDVRATEKEKVVIGDSFRVGDLIRGEVVRPVSLSESTFAMERIKERKNGDEVSLFHNHAYGSPLDQSW